ncbi:neurotrophin 1 [Bicyclus anynana]|uniref:Neurotrophin 1 n=1 Tax=Bicyclus anynana TaxID=110368 RepID=A0ABM3LND1_BICAN|nr:neurotrophin 1 [Bicyclus anynana]
MDKKMLLFIIVIFIAASVHMSDSAAVEKGLEYIDPNDNIPESCRNQTFCTIKTEDYPEEPLTKHFENHKMILQREIHTRKRRFGDEDGFECQYETSFEPLFKVKNRDGQWRTVIQSADRIQRFRLNICSNPGESCTNGIEETGIMGFVSICKQLYTLMEITVLKDNNETENIYAQLPTACTCALKKTNIE